MQEQETIDLEWADQLPFDEGVPMAPAQADEESEDVAKTEVSESLRYMVEHALRFSRVKGFDDLLEHLAGYRQYRPYNALLLLLQLPDVRFVLPAYRWEQDYRRRIRPNAQPFMALVRGGPVMFVFDISQTEETPESRPVPAFDDPLRMRDLSEAADRLEWVIENAKSDGVRVSSVPLGLGYGGCIWPVEGAPSQPALIRRRPRETKPVDIRYETVVSRRLSATERLSVLAHELGHLYCGHIGTHDERWWRARARPSPGLQGSGSRCRRADRHPQPRARPGTARHPAALLLPREAGGAQLRDGDQGGRSDPRHDAGARPTPAAARGPRISAPREPSRPVEILSPTACTGRLRRGARSASLNEARDGLEPMRGVTKRLRR
ncbi:hypothetical protein [Ornithinimicrobium pekingense]|uniref:ImmA/IrrE family metallo-endopeptidase n=1 Tax=Ornithinimicrobium pekingense TaxID=384677 RepID=A0ABQ2FDV1_9MICO|nr:hypothetical protein [Ornithinimicrobium pekingense]GGK79365.1 hypothetical protein GCM10011509_29840 [Ornithinimicrobium pekingense]